MEAALVSAARCAALASLEGLLASPSLTREALNKPASCGVTALHVSVWRNHLGLVERLLAAGADPNVPDHESGWSAVHSALYWGNLQALAELLRYDGDLALVDWRGRTPLDLVSAELKEFLGPGAGDVFSWGNGNNYTLGTGSTDLQLTPSRVESLHDAHIVMLSAAKFHSAAVSEDGRLWTFGWGRGGRLGHPEAHIHSGESAVIAPRLVSSLGKRQVLAVAAAKHHTLFCTTAGEAYTMGSNRFGQLGYVVDTQPTPRRVGALRARVVAVAAGNKHSVAVGSAGDVFTWGGNELGQLGYGTSDSTANANPRLVEAMKGKRVVAAAAAKRHTVVLTAESEVYTFGHRGVSPRRVQLAGTRDTLSAGGEQLWFHRGHQDVFRPQAVALCAGAAHTTVLTRTGVVLTWRSADPALVVQEVGGAVAGKRVVSISAGKYRTAAVTDEGDVYAWEGRSDYFPAEGRLPGSGSKKARDKGRPIPGATGPNMHVGSLGHGSPSPAEVGSYGSLGRKGSYFDRFARDRTYSSEAVQPSGLSSSSRPDGLRLGSASKGAAQADVFAKLVPERVEGLKRAVCVAVGEKHSLALQRWSAAQLVGLPRIPWLAQPQAAEAQGEAGGEEEAEQRGVGSLSSTPRGSAADLEAEPSLGDSSFASPGRASPLGPLQHSMHTEQDPEVGVPSLQRICEQEVARQLVDPRAALQVLEYADVAGAYLLRAYCLAVVVCNLDAVLLEARGAFEELAPHLLAELEQLWKLRLAGGEQAPAAAGSAAAAAAAAATALNEAGLAAGRGWAAEPAGPEEGEGEGQAGLASAVRRMGSRLQPGARPTAAPPRLGSEESDDHASGPDLLQVSPGKLGLRAAEGQSSFKDKLAVQSEAAAQRLARALAKKLQQIDSLEQRAAEGAVLDAQQRAKVAQRGVIRSALAALEGGMPAEEVQIILKAASAGVLEDGQAPQQQQQSAPSSAGMSSKKAKEGGAKGKHHAGQQQGGKRSTPAKERSSAPDAAAQPVASASRDAAAAASAAASSALAAVPEPAVAAPPRPAGSVGDAADSAALLGSSPTSTVPAFGLMGHAGISPDKSPSEPGTQVVGGFRGLDVARPPSSVERPKSAKSKEKGRRTGGLSMFLRGDLEKPATPPPAAGSSAGGASPAAAWGAKSLAPAAPPTSLKDILSQEARAVSTSKPAPAPAGKATPASAPKPRPAPAAAAAAAEPPAAGGLRMSLANFMTTSPLAIQQQQRSATASPPPPAWGGAAGASPPATQSSFRLIQEEQQQAAAARSFSTSPSATYRPSAPANLPPWRPPAAGVPASGAGAASSGLLGSSPTGSSLLGTSPSGRTYAAPRPPQQSKWYVPEERSVKSLRSIQTETLAMKELGKLYGAANVRIVPKEKKAPTLAQAVPPSKNPA